MSDPSRVAGSVAFIPAVTNSEIRPSIPATLGVKMIDPIEHVRQIIERHREGHHGGGDGIACGCGAEGLSDHSLHLAEDIVDRLGLTTESVSDAKKRIRYVSACFDEELTKSENFDGHLWAP